MKNKLIVIFIFCSAAKKKRSTFQWKFIFYTQQFQIDSDEIAKSTHSKFQADELRRVAILHHTFSILLQFI